MFGCSYSVARCSASQQGQAVDVESSTYVVAMVTAPGTECSLLNGKSDEGLVGVFVAGSS